MRRRWRRLALILTALFFFVWLLSGAVAAWMLSRRPRAPFEEPPPAWLKGVESVRLSTSDGQRLGAWYIAPAPGKPVVVLLHGIADSRSGFRGQMDTFRRQGIGSLAVSQRAHGDSSGDTCDVGWSGRNDVIAAVDYVRRVAPQHPVVVLGISMGSAAAIFAAKQLDHEVAGYILDAPYADLDVAVRVRILPLVPRPLDWFAQNGLRLWAPVFVRHWLSTISPKAHMRDIPSDVPVLLLADGADHLAPVSDITAMAQDAGAHVELKVFPKAGHVQAASMYPEEYQADLSAFLGRIH